MNTFPRHVMATKARHKTGDISRDEEDFAWVTHVRVDPKDGRSYYIGRWETGFGFINVEFPVSSCRELSWVEKKFLKDHVTVID